MRLATLAAVLLLAGSSFAAAQDAGAPPPADVPAPDQNAAPPDANPAMIGPRVQISTSKGDIILQLDAVRAPISTANIMRYVREKHYDGTAVYRVVKDFIIQMGNWDAQVRGRPVHDNIPFEGNNGLIHVRGAVALAHGEAPDSANADFFIDLARNRSLDHQGDTPDKVGYTVFGQVESGLELADAMSQVPVGDKGPMPGQAPVDPIVVSKMTLLPSEAWKTQCDAGQIVPASCEKALIAMFAPKPAAAKKPAATPPGSKSRPSGR